VPLAHATLTGLMNDDDTGRICDKQYRPVTVSSSRGVGARHTVLPTVYGEPNERFTTEKNKGSSWRRSIRSLTARLCGRQNGSVRPLHQHSATSHQAARACLT